MLRCILAALAVLVLLTASLIPDEAYARRGGGGGFRGGGGGFHGGGFRGGGRHAGRIHGGAGGFHGGGPYFGRAHPPHPIAGRPLARRPGRPHAGFPRSSRGDYRPSVGDGA